VFEAAVRTRSLTLAAHELFITHSAVSQQIKTLEEYFEQPLFLRQSRGVEPTEAALAFYAEVKASLDRIALAAEQLSLAGKSRVVRLIAAPSVAMRWLIRACRSSRSTTPVSRCGSPPPCRSISRM
jgi:LysR family glycine cleavage system transcriptional activator